MGLIQDDSKFLSKTLKTAEPVQRKKLGEVLVAMQIITRLTVERVLHISRRSGKRFGEVLEELGLVTGEELAKALAIQYGYAIIADFAKYKYDSALLKMMPAETAAEHIIFPLKLQENTLALAMADPTNERVVENLRANNKVEVRPFIATRKDILKAIDVHYLRRDPTSQEVEYILIAEHDKAMANTLSTILKKHHYEIVTALDGIDAVNKAVCFKPAVVLVDKDIPKLNGYMVFSSLKNLKETKNIPVILISGDKYPEEEAKAYEKGFADFISKPVIDVILVTKVKKTISFNLNPYVIKD